ncbi:hypothetical protein D1BOALGB6SA_10698 [Olavius sp. associated proteobacterium Delta 1]|nr:hypothetical protein D1BOALGB6SA_10698 [Olavius sp. associated proteobacterium Delta 1]
MQVNSKPIGSLDELKPNYCIKINEDMKVSESCNIQVIYSENANKRIGYGT